MIEQGFTSHPIPPERMKLCHEALQRVLQSKPGFITLLEKDPHWDLCSQAGSQLQKKYTDLCVVGMGGSSLGAKTLWHSLGYQSKGCRLHFFDTIDAREIKESFDRLHHLDKTGWLLISKSGQTMETLAIANYANQLLKSQSMSLNEKSHVFVADLSSPLAQWATQNHIDIFHLPTDICGRFSVLTASGLIPTAASGVSLKKLRDGGKWALDNKDLIVKWTGQSLGSFDRGEWIHLFWSYSRRLHVFTSWFQQLWCESLAKNQAKDGSPAPQVSSAFTCLGPEDQHSLLQQVVEGAKDKFIWFFRDEDAENYGEILKESLFTQQQSLVGNNLGQLMAYEADGTQMAVEEVGVSNHSVKVQISPESMGSLFVTCELLIATLAECLGIDAYNQPGVESSKRITAQLLNKL